MIYDCFTFFNELDMLEIRLNVLNEVVDKFVLVEMSTTHTGASKPFYFDENKERFASFKDKIIHIKISDATLDDNPETDNFGNKWYLENYQRNAIMQGLTECKPDDVIIISDLDEIPNPQKILQFKDTPGIKAFEMPVYSFYLNYKSSEPNFRSSKMLLFRDLQDYLDNENFNDCLCVVEQYKNSTNPNTVRAFNVPDENLIKNGGWHFTYFGGLEQIINKRRSIVEQQYNNDVNMSAEETEKRIKAGLDIYGRPFYLKAEEIDSRFPAYIIQNQAKYAEMIYKVDLCYKIRCTSKTLIGNFLRIIIKVICLVLPRSLAKKLRRVFIPFATI